MSAHLQIRQAGRVPTHSRAHASVALATRHLVTLTVAFLAAVLLLLSRTANGADVALSVTTAPPPLPVYEQPPLLSPGYLWMPGYWSYGPDGYFWVPGTWVLPPDPDLLWTPGYWGFSDGAYVWYPGYWGPQVGFYGGIVYGFGYFGRGFDGGYWRDHQFYYNRAVNNIGNTNVTNVYSKTVVSNTTVNNISYNGGPGGVSARPTPQEQAAGRQPRHAATSEQAAHVAGARNQHELLAAVNQGHPPIAATPKPNTFSGPAVPPAPTRPEPPRRLAQAPPPPPPPERRAPAQHPTPAAPAERTAPERPAQQSPPAEKSPPRQRRPDQPGEPPRP
jgi:hypothetical protein